MANLLTFLAYKDRAEEAAKFYCEIFPNSRIVNTVPNGDVPVAPKPGAVMIVELDLLGQRCVLLNGGEHFKFTDAISLVVQCDSQDEIDRYWNALTSGGGEPGVCGWCKDKFGVSWQINPRDIGAIVGQKDPVRAKRVFDAMMKMKKIDVATLRAAAAGA